MPKEFEPFEYMGWRISPRGGSGMYSATKGWGLLQADTVAGMKRLIIRTSKKGN